jgi:hypothetical protein
MYAIAKMHETGKTFDVKSAFDSTIWQQYIAGCLSAIMYFRPDGLEISKQDYIYSLEALGNVTTEELTQSKRNSKMEAAVDAYFADDADDDD